MIRKVHLDLAWFFLVYLGLLDESSEDCWLSSELFQKYLLRSSKQ